jgi:hypothetical protein
MAKQDFLRSVLDLWMQFLIASPDAGIERGVVADPGPVVDRCPVKL